MNMLIVHLWHLLICRNVLFYFCNKITFLVFGLSVCCCNYFQSSVIILNLECDKNIFFFSQDDNIDETYGVNVQFEESEDEVSIIPL